MTDYYYRYQVNDINSTLDFANREAWKYESIYKYSPLFSYKHLFNILLKRRNHKNNSGK